MPYRDDLDAARAALKVADDMMQVRDREILELHKDLHKLANSIKAGPTAWDKFWATPWMKAIITGFVFVNILWIVWAQYASQPEKEELRKLQLQHDGLKVKMKKERTSSIMLNDGRLTVDVGDKRVLESIPLDGDFERVLRTTTPSISDDIAFRFTGMKDNPDLDPRVNPVNWCKHVLSAGEEEATESDKSTP